MISFDLTCRELIKLFPGRKIVYFAVATSTIVSIVSTSLRQEQ
jgi:hypothetical protein